MTKAYIYPDNSVPVDGHAVTWGPKEFRRFKIPLVRVAKTTSEHTDGVKSIVGNMIIVAFPTSAATNNIGQHH